MENLEALMEKLKNLKVDQLTDLNEDKIDNCEGKKEEEQKGAVDREEEETLVKPRKISKAALRRVSYC